MSMSLLRVNCRAYCSVSNKLHSELITRKLPLTYDYLHPQPSHLLNLTLHDILPNSKSLVSPTLPSIKNSSKLPVAHHLIYFPPQVTLSQLLPDGTDILHIPGDPFNRRLWAGGNIRLSQNSLLLDGSRTVCLESIRNVAVKGREGAEKVIVTIERRMGTVSEKETEAQTWNRLWHEDEAQPGESSVIENRDLIFMRKKSAEEIQSDQAQFEKPSRIVKPPSDAMFRHSILPSRALLFRFSALTFNAHSIHLDKNYTQNEEGYRDILVHGPLTLTLILSVLQNHLYSLGVQVESFEYRNLAPLFVEEELTVCGKLKNDNSWDVWIEGPNGGLAVRGTAKTKSL